MIGHETARALRLPGMFVERKDGAFSLRRGFSLERGQPVVVVEDVFTTGKSTREAAAAVEAAGGRVVAVGSIVDRGLPSGAFSVPSRSLLALVSRRGRRPSVRSAARARRSIRREAASRRADAQLSSDRARARRSDAPSPRQALPCMTASVAGEVAARRSSVAPACFECE